MRLARRTRALASLIATWGACVCARADAPEKTAWAPVTFSPQAPPATDGALQKKCGATEAGLVVVARQIADRKAKNLPYLDVDGLANALRVDARDVPDTSHCHVELPAEALHVVTPED